jgi:glucose-1-phosphate thymidylyltransferase
MIRNESKVVGLIPAAGQANRIAPLPLSKELYPIGFQTINGRPQPKVVCHYLLDKFERAGINQAYIVLRKGKWDIPAYFGDGALVNMHLGYLMMREPFGPPFTLDQAYPFVQNKLVAFGFPDIMFGPEDVFKQLLYRQETTQSDIVLAAFPVHSPEVTDMVDIDEEGNIHAMFLKPDKSDLYYTWICAVWTPTFTEFMHKYLAIYWIEDQAKIGNQDDVTQEELTLGAVIHASIKEGLKVNGVTYPNDQYIDIGTPQNLVTAIGLFARDPL